MNAGPFLVALLVLAVATARADTALNVAGVRADLHSAKMEDVTEALKLLQGEDTVPDELIGDLLAKYAELNAPEPKDAPDDPAKAAQNLMAMMGKMGALGSFDALWDKMNPDALATAMRPYLTGGDQRAARAMIEVPSKSRRLAELLLPDLRHILQAAPDEDTVYWCTQALTPLGPKAKPAVPEWIGLLGDKREKVRECATRGLMAAGVDDPKYIPALVNGVGDSDTSVADDCHTLLTKLPFDPSKYVPQLLDDINHGFCYQAIDWLQGLGPHIVQPTIDHAANAPFDGVDSHLCVVRKFVPQVVKALANDFHSPNDNLRYMAVDIATEFPDSSQKGVDWLTPYLTDTNKNLRILALQQWIHNQPDTAKRIELLGKDIADPDLRDTAIDLAGDQLAAAKPLLPAIRAAEAKADDKTRISYLSDDFDIDPSNDATYQSLIEYLSNSNTETVCAAIGVLINDDALREKSHDLIQHLHDDPHTPIDEKVHIESEQDTLKYRQAAEKK